MAALVPPNSIRHLSGFGMALTSDGYVFCPDTVEEIGPVFDLARQSGRKVVLRGAARSYGDPAIGAEQIILDLTHLNHVLSWDSRSGIVECEPGVTLLDIWRMTLPKGWWL